MEFHISRAIRERLNIDELLFSYTGNVVFADVSASRKLASRLTQAHAAQGKTDPAAVVNAGALFAMGLIDELNHSLVQRYRKDIDPAVLQDALRWFSQKIGPDNLERLLLEFVTQFPGTEVFSGKLTAMQWLAGSAGGLSNKEAALEELMLLWLTNINPAFRSFRELFDDRDLQERTPYPSVTSALPGYLGTRPPLDPEIGSLYDALSAPMLASPDSLTGQLDFIREHWPKLLGGEMPRILLAIDVLKEEELAVWMRFHPPGPDQYRHAAPGFSGEGFAGDEYIGYESLMRVEFEVGPDGIRRRRYDKDYQAPLNEYEAFSADQAWMPNVVLMAKSTYVWLEQLSKKYGRHIHHLDHIPDEELELLATRGITGLWLIGLWERSIASRTIKRLRGHGDAVASAYSLKEYNIAEDLGGGRAYANLRDRAARFGLRLASDMVPNHMGIDSPWVIEHPDWFISRPESPFPVYQFEGPDISPDSRVEIKIEDHYYDQSDAAVVFRLRHRNNGHTRFVYHGNDGTSFAWNDTAQLDYSKAYVREHVIQTILHVARLFPIIRFDAAMVLAKRHVQRLWFPLPGAGGSIPSRAENAISEEQFDALMPNEFWREVVDRVAVEVPGTLLLAEAFWLLEGYFVRTLGMHRVYNSAFMNMLRDEENAKYRSYLKKTIEFDPDIMKRYVNFMSNPDERTAIDQFGAGDKFFGVATMLSTLPGLPMFAHGQIEGYGERYGMEFKQAKMDESPNEGLVARHQREIAPLLENRRIFAESDNFVLYDFWHEHGTVDENVFAYSNRMGDQRSLIFYNNAYASTRGSIHISAAAMDKGSGELRQKSISNGLALPTEHDVTLAYRDLVSGLEYLRRASDLDQHGFSIDLRGYQYTVLLDWRIYHSTVEYPWDRLCDSLAGRGVHSVAEALLMLRFAPVHDALRAALSPPNLAQIKSAAENLTTQGPPIGYVAEQHEGIVSSTESAPQVDGKSVEDFKSGIKEFTDASCAFFERVIDNLPVEFAESLISHVEVTDSSSDEDVRAASTEMGNGDADRRSFEEIMTDRRQSYRQKCELLLTEAVHLPALVQQLSLPVEEVWCVVPAWIALASIPGDDNAIRLFDRLQLRRALAESFSSLGLEGGERWRAAARVRVLSAFGEDAEVALTTLELWADEDVRWLTGVHDYGGATYVNQELLEDLFGWLQVPGLMKRAVHTANFEVGDNISGAADAAHSNLKHVSILEAFSRAEYDLGKYLSGQVSEGVKDRSRSTSEPDEIEGGEVKGGHSQEVLLHDE